MRSTIKKHKDFAMSDDDLVVRTRMFIARGRKTIFPNDARYGLITTKRTFRRAVDRNRARRLLRAWIRKNENLLKPDTDYIFIARQPILEASLKEGTENMRYALKQINNKKTKPISNPILTKKVKKNA